MKYLSRTRLYNFKRFREYEFQFHPKFNVLIGDNETGKSTVLLAIDLLLTASRSRIESLGLETLFNRTAIQEFFTAGKQFKDLPILRAELYFNELDDPFFNGKNNTLDTEFDGIRLVCKPDDALGPEIRAVLDQAESNFPFEYYSYTFETFSGSYYSGTKKPLKWVNVDTSSNNGEYATREYTRSMYETNLKGHEKAKHTNEYRKVKNAFNTEILRELNERTGDFTFGVKNSSRTNLESDLTVYESGISIENKGKGKQCFIKASFALSKRGKGHDLVLIEEPENHLSHVNMNRLIDNIVEASGKQVIVSTHNPLVASRLDLRNVFVLSKPAGRPATLSGVPEDVAKYFMKAPGSSLLEFILSAKTILVEGAAEYILMEAFFLKETGKHTSELGTQIISVNGTGFKNYIHIAKLIGSKVVVIRDNDGNYAENILENYKDLLGDTVGVFADEDVARSTFEICVYDDNKGLCDDLFKAGRRTLSVQNYMLGNKTESAFEILSKKYSEISVPKYIGAAFKWLNS